MILASALVPQTLLRASASARLPALTVRLEPPVAPPQDFSAIAVEREQPREPEGKPRTAGSTPGRARHPEVKVADSVPAPRRALPQIPDETVYPVSDLDFLPRPVAELDLDRLLEGASPDLPAAIGLDLTIDENGVVREIAIPDAGGAGSLETRLRTVLASTRFVPARKDGRPVKSRVTLRVGLRSGHGAQ